MWPRGKLFYTLCALVLCSTASARAQGDREVAVWYRSASACPDGDAFLRMLEARSVQARLAQVGDAIDFVVTLGGDGAASGGVLERQTETGTVAIRRVDDPSCEQVAAALSLTLALALEAADAEPAQPSPAAEPTAIQPEPAPQQAPAAAPEPTEAASSAQVALALSGRAATGIAPGLLLGGSLALELALGHGLWRPAFRAGLVIGYGSGTRDGQDITTTLASGQLEGCPLELAASSLSLRPCLALEVGQLRSEGDGSSGRSDRGLWLASELRGRVRWQLAAAFALEAALGVALPWTRYELRSARPPERVVHRTSAASAALEIGVVVRFP